MKLYVFLADGFETVEALGVVDILRRGGVDVCTVSISDTRTVTTAHKIPVMADGIFTDYDYEDGDALFLPGGIPGTPNLEAHQGLHQLIDNFNNKDKYICAICAAPSILGHYGILNGKRATSYPGYEDDLKGAEYTAAGVEVDGKVVTGRGMGKTIDFGLKLLEIFSDKENAIKIGKAIQYL